MAAQGAEKRGKLSVSHKQDIYNPLLWLGSYCRRGRKNVGPEDIVKDSEILSSGDNTDLATTCSQRL